MRYKINIPFFVFVGLLFFGACESNEKVVKELAPINKLVLETAVIYEANIRQYSLEGSFEAFTKDIPKLKELGVKIIWVMPIFPISQTKRKATGGDFAYKLEDPKAQKRALGSYYAVSDFTKVNPEFGTIDDFRKLVQKAHDNEIYVILDWVPNHTGWDHTWIKSNPDFYTKNSKGEITEPLNDDGSPIGWADVADLNYNSKLLRETMIKDMMYWISEENIDGFRCDVAGLVPIDFWQEVIPKLRGKKDIFMLAEAWESELLEDGLFDMAYGWDAHHTMNDIGKGHKNAVDWNTYMNKRFINYEPDDILMNFITNHDENSWSGTVKERMGDASELMLALSFIMPGMPLIYSGQEYDLNHRLLFFEKDEIPKIRGRNWELLKKLGMLKNENLALNGGVNSASYINIKSGNEYVLIFEREKNGEKVIFIGNLSDSEQNIEPSFKGFYVDYMNNTNIQISGRFSLKPWEYKVLIVN